MARSKKTFFTNWQENYAGLILGAIIVIILGLLVANFISKRNEQINDNGEQSKSEEKMSTSTTYTVEKGDSLSKIAEKTYGDQKSWPILARVNNIANPNLIYVGKTLEIPSKEKAEEVKAQMTQTSYEVQKGDTIFAISEKMYGDGFKWPQIAKANNIGRLPNGNPLIFAGSTLKIPR